MANAVDGVLRAVRENFSLPAPARLERRRDRRAGLSEDPGCERAIETGLAWLCRAQDESRTSDGGVARHFSLIDGWGPSYPETTGYIIPTLLAQDGRARGGELRERARRMLDWLVAIQLPGGGFQGGTVDAVPVVPVTFNTGQILIGLAAGVEAFGDVYRGPMRGAADWLVDTQDADGAWRKHPTPFAQAGLKTYETHVAWGLMEASRAESDAASKRRYSDAAENNVRWAMTHQAPNGWFDHCCLNDQTQPLTHTIGYVLRGVLEMYDLTNDRQYFAAAQRAGIGLLSAIRSDGYIPGQLDAQWNGTVPWACLTGIAQISHCWLKLYQGTGDARFRDAAYSGTQYVRRTMHVDGDPDMRGGVKGSFPVDGEYGRYEFLNWACKFMIDVNRLELLVRAG